MKLISILLNGALEIETLKTPEELLEKALSIEKETGRERLIHWGPRTLDIDILFYDDEIIMTDNLKIPSRLYGIRGCKWQKRINGGFLGEIAFFGISTSYVISFFWLCLGLFEYYKKEEINE